MHITTRGRTKYKPATPYYQMHVGDIVISRGPIYSVFKGYRMSDASKLFVQPTLIRVL